MVGFELLVLMAIVSSFFLKTLFYNDTQTQYEVKIVRQPFLYSILVDSMIS